MEDIKTKLTNVTDRMRSAWPLFGQEMLGHPELDDLTFGDIALLLVLSHGREVTANDLPHGSSVKLTSLATKKYIDLLGGGRYRLGEQGRQALERLMATRLEGMAKLLRELPQDQRESVVKAMETMAKAIAAAPVG